MDDLPNGFTGFSHKPEGFVSAGEASRISRARAAGAGAGSTAGYGAGAMSETPSTARSGFGPTPSASSGRARSDRGGEGRPATKVIPFDEYELARISDADQRDAWVEIDLSAVRYNAAALRRLLSPRARLMATVAADACGHGAVEVAKAVVGAGADRLVVSTVSEGVELRKAGLTVPILLMSQPPAASIPLLLAYDIVPAVYEPDFAVAYGEKADLHGMTARFQLAVDTGMNRIGVRYEDVVEFLYQVSFHRALELEGVFTEYATADYPETLDFQLQTKRFIEAVEAIGMAGFDPGVVHAADSAALIRYPAAHFNAARTGMALFGLHPCPETHELVELRPSMSVHARIVDVRQPGVSEGVSHGLRYRSPGSVKVCTIPVGYADGLRLGLSGNTDVIVRGHYFRQVGEICMDHCMFEVDLRRSAVREFVNPQVGEEVLVIGSQGIAQITIDEMAEKLGTSSREIAIGFGQRLPRVYR